MQALAGPRLGIDGRAVGGVGGREVRFEAPAEREHEFGHLAGVAVAQPQVGFGGRVLDCRAEQVDERAGEGLVQVGVGPDQVDGVRAVLDQSGGTREFDGEGAIEALGERAVARGGLAGFGQGRVEYAPGNPAIRVRRCVCTGI